MEKYKSPQMTVNLDLVLDPSPQLIHIRYFYELEWLMHIGAPRLPFRATPSKNPIGTCSSENGKEKRLF